MASEIEAKKYDAGFYKSQMDGSYRSALHVLPIVNELLQPKSVLDVGCGVGSWLKAWKEINPSLEILGIDGDYVNKSQLYIPEPTFIAKDLKKDFSLGRSFDLVMSLEVGEHIPTGLSQTLVKNLVSHSRYVLFSAAIPFQQGTFHINEQFPEFWAKLFAIYDYYPVDILRNKIWNNDEIEWWYRQNLILYVHKSELVKNAELIKYKEVTNANALTRIHPQVWVYLNKDFNKITRSFFSFIKWKLSYFKKKFIK